MSKGLPQPQPASTSVALSYSSRLTEHLTYKGRLQEYTLQWAIQRPIYGNEGTPHGPKFRIEGYPLIHEQDVSKLAVEHVSKKIKDEWCPLIHEDMVLCKSILNEFAINKMNLGKPTYNTAQPESKGLLLVFSSLDFNGISYTDGHSGNKK
nr:double-stranded rna-binding protein 4 [Quercus suber]